VSNDSIPLSSYEIASNDPHGEEYIEPSLVFCVEEFVKGMTITLETVVEEEKSSEVFGEALENKINKFDHILDAGLKKMTSHIDSTKMTSRIQHKTVMQ
jgi:hypothetical protein